MELTPEQKKTVAQWVKEGCGLSEIQKRMNEQLKLPVTYMDVRLMLIDLNLQLKDQEAPRAATRDIGGSVGKAAAQPAADDVELLGKEAAGGVTVDVDRLMRPGAIVSGTVTFSDGVTAKWMLDQTGRLGIEASRPGYRPTPEDVQSFQETLSAELQKRGF